MIDTESIKHNIKYGLFQYSNQDIIDLCDEIDRLRAGKPKPQGKTVRVKVAVAVDEFKHWSASGWDGASEAEMEDGLFDLTEGSVSVYWLTADLPIPEETTIEAEVENA